MPVSQFPAISGNTPQALGYAEITTTVTSISGTFTDVSGLSVTVNVAAGRRIKISAHALLQQRTSAGQIVFAIWEDGIRINEDAFNATTDSYITGNASCIRTPTTGAHTYKITAGTTANTVDLITGTNFPAFILVEDITGVAIPAPPVSVPVGLLAQAQATATTANMSDADVGLSVNISVAAGRIVRLTWHESNVIGSIVSDVFEMQIREGSTNLTREIFAIPTGNYENRIMTNSVVLSPSAGSHTYSVHALRISGTGQVSFGRAADAPAYLIAEDITPTPVLASGAPSSVLAYAENLALSVTGISTIQDVAGLSVTVTIPAGRRIRVSAQALVRSSAAGTVACFEIWDTASRLQTGKFYNGVAAGTDQQTASTSLVLSPAAGTYTYKARIFAGGGGSTVDIISGTTFPAYIMVEDITGVSYNYTSPGLLPVNSSSPPSSPSVGSMIYEYDTGKSKIYSGSGWGELTTGSTITLGYAQVVANQLNLPTGITDLTGLAVTVTVPAGRRLRVSGFVTFFNSVAGANVGILHIRESATTLVDANAGFNNTAAYGDTNFVQAQAVISPTAGTHTYYLSSQFGGGTTNSLSASSTRPSFILVEDITGTTVPVTSASVPVGQLAYSEATSNQSYTTLVGLTGLSVNVVVPAGRVIRLTGQLYLNTDIAATSTLVYISEGGTNFSREEVYLPAATRGDVRQYSAIISPSAGAHTYNLRAERAFGTGTLTSNVADHTAFLMAEDITPTPASSTGAPGSTLAYSETITNPYPSGFTAESEVVRATFTVPAGRRVRVTAKCEVTVANTDQWVAGDIRISTVGGTGIGQGTFSSAAASQQNTLHIETVLTPAAGTYTYLFTIRKVSGTGNVTLDIGANVPAFILVEDITGSVWPAGSSVTAGMVASEAWTTFTPIVTQGAAPTQTVNKGAYSKIGRTVIAQGSVSFTGAGTAGQPILITNLPVPASSNTLILGSFRYFDAGNTNFAGTVVHSSTTTCSLYYQGDGNAMGAGTPTVASGDLLQFSVTYEAAS